MNISVRSHLFNLVLCLVLFLSGGAFTLGGDLSTGRFLMTISIMGMVTFVFLVRPARSQAKR